jgi:hypothetical protein
MASPQILDEWHDLVIFLNQRIAKNGKVERNDRELWVRFLHRWNNSDWTDLIEACAELYQQHPDLFQSFHKAAVRDSIKAMLNGSAQSRIMDTDENKRTAWKMIMTLREVWIAAENYNSQPSDLNRFGSLFNDSTQQ